MGMEDTSIWMENENRNEWLVRLRIMVLAMAEECSVSVGMKATVHAEWPCPMPGNGDGEPQAVLSPSQNNIVIEPGASQGRQVHWPVWSHRGGQAVEVGEVHNGLFRQPLE